MRSILAIALLAVTASGGRALAQPAEVPAAEGSAVTPPPVTPPPSEHRLTASDVANAPLPGDEHGRVDPIDTGDGVGRILGRIVLWIPRIPLELIMAPPRGALYAQERYHVADKIKSVFVSDDGKLGIYPTALRETGFGLNIGVRAFVRDLLGQGEKLSLRAGFGGQENRVVSADLDTGKRLSKWFSAGVQASYENRDRDRFFGYGNADLTHGAPPAPVDVRDPNAPDISSRFRMNVARVTPRARFNLPHYLRLTLVGALAHKSFGITEDSGEDVSIEKAYDIRDNALPGFVRGTSYLYTEAELQYDSRRPADAFDQPGMHGTGGQVLGYVGRQTGLGADDHDFYRIGVNLERAFRLTPGPRAIEVRAYGEMVTGDRDQIPFTEMPRLGGSELLRGYVNTRFRDKVAMVGSAAYVFLIGRSLAGQVFVDAGRVYDSLEDVTLSGLRVGYGIALEAYSTKGVLVNATVASSIDGGLFFFFSFNPVFDARHRVERY